MGVRISFRVPLYHVSNALSSLIGQSGFDSRQADQAPTLLRRGGFTMGGVMFIIKTLIACIIVFVIAFLITYFIRHGGHNIIWT